MLEYAAFRLLYSGFSSLSLPWFIWVMVWFRKFFVRKLFLLLADLPVGPRRPDSDAFLALARFEWLVLPLALAFELLW